MTLIRLIFAEFLSKEKSAQSAPFRKISVPQRWPGHLSAKPVPSNLPMRWMLLLHGLGLDDLPLWVWLALTALFTLSLLGALWLGSKLQPELADKPEDENTEAE